MSVLACYSSHPLLSGIDTAITAVGEILIKLADSGSPGMSKITDIASVNAIHSGLWLPAFCCPEGALPGGEISRKSPVAYLLRRIAGAFLFHRVAYALIFSPNFLFCLATLEKFCSNWACMAHRRQNVLVRLGEWS